MSTIPYIQRVRKPDGTTLLYFRKSGYRERLYSPDGSEELRKEVDTHLARIKKIKDAQTPKPGSVSGALMAYVRSADFAVLSSRTKKDYDYIATAICEEIGILMLTDIDFSLLSQLRDSWASGHGYRAANIRMQVLKNALKPAIDDGRIKEDPFSRLKNVKRPHDLGESNPAWEDTEVTAVIDYAIAHNHPGLARAIALGRYGGFRKGTICRITLNARSLGHDKNGNPTRRINWLTEKRHVQSDKREDPRLTEILSKTPSKALTIAYNKDNQPWTERALSQAVSRVLTALAQDGKVRPDLTLHGLRHSRGVELALSGASDAEIMSQMEHTTDHAAKVYRRQADRRNLADNAQDRVDTVINISARNQPPKLSEASSA